MDTLTISDVITKTIPVNDNKNLIVIKGVQIGPGVFDTEKITSIYFSIDCSGSTSEMTNLNKFKVYKIDGDRNILTAISSTAEPVLMSQYPDGPETNFLKVSFDNLVVSSESSYYIDIICPPDFGGLFAYMLGTPLDITAVGESQNAQGFTPIISYDSMDPGSALPDVEISDDGTPVEPEEPTTPEISKKPIKSLSKNSIWPNGIKTDNDGYTAFYTLGTNKINIPSSSSAWPKGNKLISPFVYQDNKLVGFCDTKAMEVGDATIIVMPYEHIEAEFSSIDKGTLQIATPKATYKKASWKNDEMDVIPEAQYKYKGCEMYYNINSIDSNYKTTDIVDGTWSELLCDLKHGDEVFADCHDIITFNSDMCSLVDSMRMFYNCTNLISFTSDLSSLVNSYSMFENCSNLASFTTDLSSLIDGGCMFENCSNLAIFTGDLNSLTDGSLMFGGCSNLSTIINDTIGSPLNLSSLTIGYFMFRGCSSLTSFKSELSSLTNGNGMFSGCRLDTASVQNIANTINDVTDLENGNIGCGDVWKYINIDIGNSTPNTEESEAFNKIASKGWTVYVNGSQYTPASPAAIITLDETGEEFATPIPYYAKPQQTVEEYAKYVDDEGNFFNILGGQFIYGDDISTYGMFTCEEDAAQNMRLTPYTKNTNK